MKRLLLLPLLVLSISAGAQCVASFTATSSPSNNNLLRWYFSNTSSYGTGGTYAYNTATINFGDGTTGSGYSTYHNYTSPGTYTVGFRIYRIDSMSNNIICTDSTTQTIAVAYSACGTTIAAANTSGGVVNFTIVTPAGTSGMTYSINYGDGTSGASLSHTYSANGYYTVTLSATGGGCTYTNVVTVYVSTAPVSCGNLHASFTSSLSTNIAYFNNTSTYSSGLTNVQNWTYGDGTTGTAASHTYMATGTYTVKLVEKWLDSATMGLHCSDSVTHSVTIYYVSPVNYITGTVYWDSTSTNAVDSFQVWLIQYNSVTNLLTAIDSTYTGGYLSGSFYFYNEPSGNYLIKAGKSLNTTIGNFGSIPTYHDSSLYWSSAANITYASGASLGNNIWMRHGIISSGPGFVAGNVSLGANKGAGAGVEGMLIFLRDANNTAIASTYTDANGDFTFQNVPLGTYSVYPEAINYATIAAGSVSVTTGNTHVSDINFNQDNNQMNIKPWNLVIADPFAYTSPFVMYPNPASHSINISLSGVDADGAHLIITNTTGQVVIDYPIAHSSSSSFRNINIAALVPGMYFVYGTAQLHGAVQKLIVE